MSRMRRASSRIGYHDFAPRTPPQRANNWRRSLRRGRRRFGEGGGMTFRIGMKVCCIHEGEWQARYSLFTRTYHRWLCRFPELGKVYTVAAVDLLDTDRKSVV